MLVLQKLCLAAIASCTGMTAFAQSGASCTAIANDTERLACYDRALRPAAPEPAASPDDRRQERRVRESAAPPPAAVPPAPATARAGAPPDETTVPIVVVGIRALPGREATFTTEDGVAWVQTDSQRLVGLPDTPFAAEIKPGTMGSYFLVPTERGRAVRVRRVR
jgi:hypothetical protein